MSAIGGFLQGLFGLAGTQLENNASYDIANMNLRYQQERNAIEDERYEDETKYNRAFAEDERDYQRAFAEDERSYNRALQQEIFNREDTALERQASQLSALGINPLSQQMTGLDSGQALSPSAAGTTPNVPTSSSRGGQALHNDYQPNYVTPLLSLADSINSIKTGISERDLLKKQRDALELENQAKKLDNLIKAKKYKIKINDDGSMEMDDYKHSDQDFSDVDYKDKNASAERNQRENAFQNEYKTHDNSPKEELILTALENQTENNNLFNRGLKQAANIANTISNPEIKVISYLGGLASEKIKQARAEKRKDKGRFHLYYKDKNGKSHFLSHEK